MPLRLFSRGLAAALLAAALLAGAVSVSPAPARAEEAVFPPSSRFGFKPPSDMTISKRFTGFERIGGGATDVRAAVFPGEGRIPAAPAGQRGDPDPGEGQIADRHRAQTGMTAIAIGEGVELLDMTERMAGLALHPAAQAGLQRAMLRLQRPRGQRARPGRPRLGGLDGQGHRLGTVDGRQHRDQFGNRRVLAGQRFAAQ